MYTTKTLWTYKVSNICSFVNPDGRIDRQSFPQPEKGAGGHSEKGHTVRVESFEKGTFCACALCVKDKRGISNVMWKSTSIFIGTGRLTSED